MVTEIVTFPLRETVSSDNVNKATEEALRDTLNIVALQDGFQRAFWGRELENPNIVRLFVDWDSPEAHYEFMQKDYYKPFVEKLDETASVPQIQAFHAYLSPHPAPEALSASTALITEVLTIYFPTDYSDIDQQNFEDNTKQFIDIIEGKVTGYTGSAKGWVMEELPLPGTSQKAKAYVLCLGWQSRQAQLTFRETGSYKENVRLLRGVKDLRHIQEVHFSGIQVNHREHF